MQKDTSIMANLRRNGLDKSPKHRNWREWDAICDNLEDQLADYDKKLFLAKNRQYAAYGFGTAFGLILAYIIIYL